MNIERLIEKVLCESTSDSKKLYQQIEAYCKKNITSNSSIVSLKKDSSTENAVDLDLVFNPRPRKKVNVNIQFADNVYLLTVKANYINKEKYNNLDKLLQQMLWNVVAVSNL